MASPFWAKPGAFSPWAQQATDAEQRGELRRQALDAGLTLTLAVGSSPRGPWTVELRDVRGRVYRQEGGGSLAGLIERTIEAARLPEGEARAMEGNR